MVTTGDPEAQKHDATQDLLVIECQNNAIQNHDVDAAQTEANEEKPVGGVMNEAFPPEGQKSTNEERKKEYRQGFLELTTSLLFSILLPVYIGVYTVISVQYTATSNDQSQMANQIALLALCYSNSSSKFCADLLAQTDLYLPKIANNLYGLEPTSGNGKSQPIARETPESTTNIAYSVFLKGSPAGRARFKSAEYMFIVFTSMVLIYGMGGFCYKGRELTRKTSARGITASRAAV